MPNGTHLLDAGFPSFTGRESTAEKLDRIQNYLFQLLEELRFLLHNLGTDNFNASELTKLESDVAEAVAGTVTAETIISNTLITNELYADFGSIADLTVWRLRTDYLRAQNWLLGNTAQLDYIDIHDEHMDFISAVTDGSETVQLSRDGLRYYWTDGTQTRMTCTEETPFPVYVYRYTELTKLSVSFRTVVTPDGELVMPVITLGAGDGEGNSIGYLFKDRTALRLRCVASGGVVHELSLGDSGAYLDGVRVELDGDIPRFGGLGIQVVTEYPETEAENVLYIRTEEA